MIQVLLHHRWNAHLYINILDMKDIKTTGTQKKLSSKKLNTVLNSISYSKCIDRGTYVLVVYPYIYELHMEWSNHNCRKNKAKILLIQSVDQRPTNVQYSYSCMSLYNSAPLNLVLPLSGFLYLILQYNTLSTYPVQFCTSSTLCTFDLLVLINALLFLRSNSWTKSRQKS